MRALCRIAFFIATLLLSAATAQAITFDQIFFAGDSQNGQLGAARTQFSPDESRIYLRFIYRNGNPGQELIAHWQIVEDDRGRSGEFATARMTLEKPADRGQFSYEATEPWPIGRYRVTITGSDNIILEEVDYQVVSGKARKTVAPTAKAASVQDAVENDLPPPFTEILAAAPDRFTVSRILTAGRSEAQQFDRQEPVIYVRYEYFDATPNLAVDAVWEHLGNSSRPGTGIFARDRVRLEKNSGRAQFSFRPKPAGSWLPGDYKVTMLNGSKIIGSAQFTIWPDSGQVGTYDDIVVAVSGRTGLAPDALNRLYQQQPDLFANLRKMLVELKDIEQLLTTDPETLARSFPWHRQDSRALHDLLQSLRSYSVSRGLLPEGVTTSAVESNLLRAYSAARSDRTPVQAFADTLATEGNFPGRKALYTRLLKAKGQTEASVSAELQSYLQGKADLYWRNRLEVAYQHARLKEHRGDIVNSLWAGHSRDLERIRATIP